MFRQNVKIATDRNVKHCPSPNCKQFVDISSLNSQKVDCPKCKNAFCKECSFSWHPDKTCQKLREEVYGEWAGNYNSNKCPNCLSHVEKDEGCDHMTCAFCGH